MNNIKLIREINNYSQAQAARIIGISRARLCQYEKGHRYPPIKTLIQMSKVYNVSTDFLLGNVNNNEKEVILIIYITLIEEGLIVPFQELTEEKLAILKDVLKYAIQKSKNFFKF